MNRGTRAVLLVFNGTEVNKNQVSVFAEAIGEQCNAESVDFAIYSPEDIASMIMRSHIISNAIEEPKELEKRENTPEDEAVTYIGTIMKDALMMPFDGYNLFRAITLKIDELKTGSNEELKKFMNALFILSQENLVISKSLMRKYHFSAEKISTIKKTYNFVTGF